MTSCRFFYKSEGCCFFTPTKCASRNAYSAAMIVHAIFSLFVNFTNFCWRQFYHPSNSLFPLFLSSYRLLDWAGGWLLNVNLFSKAEVSKSCWGHDPFLPLSFKAIKGWKRKQERQRLPSSILALKFFAFSFLFSLLDCWIETVKFGSRCEKMLYSCTRTRTRNSRNMTVSKSTW